MTYETKKKIRAMISKGFNHGFFFSDPRNKKIFIDVVTSKCNIHRDR